MSQTDVKYLKGLDDQQLKSTFKHFEKMKDSSNIFLNKIKSELKRRKISLNSIK